MYYIYIFICKAASSITYDHSVLCIYTCTRYSRFNIVQLQLQLHVKQIGDHDFAHLLSQILIFDASEYDVFDARTHRSGPRCDSEQEGTRNSRNSSWQ